MAAKRGKTQARRSGGNGGNLPGWAWLVIGVALTLLVVLAAPKLLKPGSEGFFKPTPNPDAQPQPVDEEAVVDPERDAPAVAATAPATRPGKSTEYDFYRLLPGEEVRMSDAELAASEQAERERTDAATAAAKNAAAAEGNDAATPLPAPVATAPETPDAPAATPPSTATGSDAAASASAPPAATDSARYLLQAGAFEASGQAEELKAKIAMLGLGARVESARIGERTVYRVRMGPYGSATELAEAKRKLAAGGLPAIAVRTQ